MIFSLSSPFARAGEFGLSLTLSRETRLRPSRPAPACLSSTLRLNIVLTDGISSVFRDGAYLLFLIIPSTAIELGQVQSLSGYYAILYRLCDDDVYCQESAGTRPPVVLKILVVPATTTDDAAFSGITVGGPIINKLYRGPLFSHTHYYYTLLL